MWIVAAAAARLVILKGAGSTKYGIVTMADAAGAATGPVAVLCIDVVVVVVVGVVAGGGTAASIRSAVLERMERDPDIKNGERNQGFHNHDFLPITTEPFSFETTTYGKQQERCCSFRAASIGQFVIVVVVDAASSICFVSVQRVGVGVDVDVGVTVGGIGTGIGIILFPRHTSLPRNRNDACRTTGEGIAIATPS